MLLLPPPPAAATCWRQASAALALTTLLQPLPAEVSAQLARADGGAMWDICLQLLDQLLLGELPKGKEGTDPPAGASGRKTVEPVPEALRHFGIRSEPADPSSAEGDGAGEAQKLCQQPWRL